MSELATLTSSRAVVRPVEVGCAVNCLACGQPVKFSAKEKRHQVICNVYRDGRWWKVEHYHADCYTNLGEPHGPTA